MKFKKLRKILSRTDRIQTCLKSTGDTDKVFLTVSDIPDTYDNFSVISVGVTHITDIQILGLVPAIEIYLDNVKSRKKEMKHKEETTK